MGESNMELKKVFLAVSKKLSQMELSTIWEEFKMYDFILYTKEEYCYKNEIYPNKDYFYGNTAIYFQEKYCAIWGLDSDPIEDIDLLASLLVHEMFHCYQTECMDKRFPDDLRLLSIPNDEKLCNLRYQDSLLLIEGLKNPRLEILEKICFIRNEMLKYNSTIEEEFKSETIEGTAEYTGCEALRQLSLDKYKNQLKLYCEMLSSIELQLNPRKRSYYSGCLFLILLKKLSIQFPLFSNLSHFQVISKSIKKLPVLIKMDSIIAEEIKKNTLFLEQLILPFKTHLICFESNIVSYDPMNMVRFKDYFFCKSFVILDNGEKKITFKKPVLLKMKRNSNEVEGYYISKL